MLVNPAVWLDMFLLNCRSMFGSILGSTSLRWEAAVLADNRFVRGHNGDAVCKYSDHQAGKKHSTTTLADCRQVHTRQTVGEHKEMEPGDKPTTDVLISAGYRPVFLSQSSAC